MPPAIVRWISRSRSRTSFLSIVLLKIIMEQSQIQIATYLKKCNATYLLPPSLETIQEQCRPPLAQAALSAVSSCLRFKCHRAAAAPSGSPIRRKASAKTGQLLLADADSCDILLGYCRWQKPSLDGWLPDGWCGGMVEVCGYGSGRKSEDGTYVPYHLRERRMQFPSLSWEMQDKCLADYSRYSLM